MPDVSHGELVLGNITRQMSKEYTLDEYLSRLDELAASHGQDWEPVLKECEPIIATDILDHFDTATGPYETWPQHSQATTDRYGPHQLLILSGELAAAATGQGTGHYFQIDANSIEFGVDAGVVLYAWAQQAGMEDKNLPARPYMWLSEDAISQMNELVVAHGIRTIE